MSVFEPRTLTRITHDQVEDMRTTPPPILLYHDANLQFRSKLSAINPNRVKFVVVHHTANSNPKWGVRECHEWHKNGMKWNGIGYNYFIEQDGKVFFGRADKDRDYIASHVAGHNSSSIGVCLDGHYSQQTPTPENIAITARVVADCLKRYNLPTTAIRYHNELDTKDCPGKNFPSRAAFTKEVEKWL